VKPAATPDRQGGAGRAAAAGHGHLRRDDPGLL